MTSRRTKRLKKASRIPLVAHDQGDGWHDASCRGDASSTRTRYPVPTGEFETLEADSVILALGQDTDTTFLKNAPGITFKSDGTVVVGRDMQTGCPGVFAGGDMVRMLEPSQPPSGMERKPPGTSTPGSAARRARSRSSTTSQHSRCCGSGITPRQRGAVRARSTSSEGDTRSTRSSPGSIRRRRATRRNAASLAAIASSATGATRPAPSTPSSNWALANGTSTTWTSAPVARSVTTSAPAVRSPWSRNPSRRTRKSVTAGGDRGRHHGEKRENAGR